MQRGGAPKDENTANPGGGTGPCARPFLLTTRSSKSRFSETERTNIMGNKRVAVVIAHNFEDIEVTSPVQAVESAGAEFVLIGIEPGEVVGKKGHTFTVD